MFLKLPENPIIIQEKVLSSIYIRLETEKMEILIKLVPESKANSLV